MIIIIIFSVIYNVYCIGSIVYYICIILPTILIKITVGVLLIMQCTILYNNRIPDSNLWLIWHAHHQLLLM